MYSLDSAESFLDLIFEKMPVGVIVVSKDKQIRKVNPKLLKMMGLDHENDLVGKSCARMLCPDNNKGCAAIDRNVFLESAETTLPHTSGTKIPVKRKIMRADIEGETFIVEFYEDLSLINKTRNAYKESKQRLLTFLETCIDPVLIYDLNGQAVYTNPSFKSVFGWDIEELMMPETFITKDPDDLNEKVLNELESSCSGILSERTTKKGRNIEVIINAAPLTDDNGDPGGSVVFVKPLTAADQNMITDIGDRTDQLFSDIISDINFDLRMAMEDICEHFSQKAADKQIDFTMTIHQFVPSLIKGDPWRLRQILQHLISNAVKHTSKGDVSVSAILENENSDTARIRFEVSDTGMGMPPGKLARIFDSSLRSNGTKPDLSELKQIISVMKGSIDASSQQGTGSVFKVCLPFKKQTMKDEVPIFKLKHLSDKHIMAISDDLRTIRHLKDMCTSWGCRFADASDHQEAMEKLEISLEDKTPFDLIIMDMQMGRSDPEHLAREVKENPDLFETQIIMLSDGGKRGDARRLKSIGVTGYLPKPIIPEQLHDCMVTVLAAAFPSTRTFITRHSLKEDKKKQVHILLAEDNTVNQKLVLNILKKSGYKAHAVNDGPSAVEAFETGKYNIVYMDVQMSLVDGYKTAQAIREAERHEKAPPIPIIAMTASAMENAMEECRKYGISDYIRKPVMPMDLLESVAKWTWQNKTFGRLN